MCCSSWRIAETREKARAEAREGLMRHHNQYIVGTLQRPGAKPFSDPDEAVDKTAFSTEAAATIGTPDDLVARIKSVIEVSGGFGTVVGFVHDWANPENTMRSWDMVARYVVPEINGYLAGLRQSQHFVATNRGVFDRAKEAIMAKISENEAARAALAVTTSVGSATWRHRRATCPISKKPAPRPLRDKRLPLLSAALLPAPPARDPQVSIARREIGEFSTRASASAAGSCPT